MRLLLIILFIAVIHNLTLAQTNLLLDTGKVGIGTLTPRSPLEIYDFKSFLNIASSKPTESMVNNEVIGGINFYKHYALANGASIKMLQGGGPNNYSMAHLAFYTASGGNPYNTIPEERMRITSTGEVAIGTTDAKGYKLAVAGKIIAESVKIQLQGAWSDFVFAKDYDLPSLQETERYIKNKGHLQGIPSTATVKANGIDLGEMNAKLLQKIEELTLYLIDKDKEQQVTNKKIKDLENRLKSVEIKN